MRVRGRVSAMVMGRVGDRHPPQSFDALIRVVRSCTHKRTHEIHLIITRAVPDLNINNMRYTHAFSKHEAVGTNPQVMLETTTLE